MSNSFFESTENLIGAKVTEPYFVLNDCIMATGVGPDKNASSIADQNGDIILQANNENLVWLGGCIHRFRSALGYGPLALKRVLQLQQDVTERLNEQKPTITVSEPAIFLGHAFGWHAYGHLHDTLQRLLFLKEILKDRNFRFIVNRYDRIVDFADHLGALLGRDIEPTELIVIDNSSTYIFEELVFSHAPATMTNYTQESLQWMSTSYREFFFDDSLRKPKGLYLSRNHIRPGSRGVSNESEVTEFLAEQNFMTVTGNEPLNLIVNLFAHAELIVGAHGSLFANTFLCGPHCRILEFCPSNRIDVTFKNKLKNTPFYTQEIIEADPSYNICLDISRLAEFVAIQ
jgi:hypothetical protein